MNNFHICVYRYIIKLLKRKLCNHRFDYEDLIARPTPDGNVIPSFLCTADWIYYVTMERYGPR